MQEIKHTLNQRFGGYITYWKLYFQFFIFIFSQKIYRFGDKLILTFIMILKFPWYLFIKPLGSLFSVKKQYHIIIKFNKIFKSDKSVIFKFIGIPLFKYSTKKINDKDKDKDKDILGI